jgi:nitroreductase
MHETDNPPDERLRPLVRVRQIRDFTSEPPSAAELHALTEVARWSGSSNNEQPWRFITITEPETIRFVAETYMPSSRALRTAPAAIAIALPDESGRAVMHGYDEGRAAERILIGASFLGLGAAITWVWPDARPTVRRLLGIPDGWLVRTIMAVGHPTEAARRPKAAPGAARKPREETVFAERWPARDS